MAAARTQGKRAQHGKPKVPTGIAVLEKGWLGGGNTARNTTILRSNYLWEESPRRSAALRASSTIGSVRA